MPCCISDEDEVKDWRCHTEQRPCKVMLKRDTSDAECVIEKKSRERGKA